MKIKTEEEVKRTLRERHKIDYGIFDPKGIGLYFSILGLLLILLCIILKVFIILFTLVAIFFFDWLAFIIKRGRALSRYNRYIDSEMHLKEPADVIAVDELFNKEGLKVPSMEDLMGLDGSNRFSRYRNEQRYRECYKEFRSIMGEGIVKVVLDVGTGNGVLHYKFGFDEAYMFCGVDIMMGLLKQFKNKAGTYPIQAMGEELSFRNNTIDLIVCTESLEHFVSPESGIKEFSRVLSQGGHLILSVPNATRIRNLNPFHLFTNFIGLVVDDVLLKKVVHENTFMNVYTNHWDFSMREVKKMCLENGLVVLRSYSTTFPVPWIGLLKKESIFDIVEGVLRFLPVVKYLGRDLFIIAKKL